MESQSFELSDRGFADAAAFDPRFVFVVGGVEYPCCRFHACFFSGLVRRLLASDGCVSRVYLKVNDKGRHFKDVVSLMTREKISITRQNVAFLEACARELENDELLGATVGFQLDQDISMSNLVYRLSRKREFHGDPKSELDFLALHFFEAPLHVLRSLSVSELEMVLLNPMLRLESEDQLYNTIISLTGEKGDEALVLLRYIEVTFLSPSTVDKFLDRIFPDFVAHFWGPLCQRLRCESGLSMQDRAMEVRRYHCETFPRTKGTFIGIVRHLGELCHGDPHSEGLISISSSGKTMELLDVIQYGYDRHNWTSHDEPNSFIKFDFKSRRVCLSHYSLMSGTSNKHLISWVIEVSDDDSTWEVVDERNTQDLNRNQVAKTYQCNKPNERYARFVRLRQTGVNSAGSNVLGLGLIEFFGNVRKWNSF